MHRADDDRTDDDWGYDSGDEYPQDDDEPELLTCPECGASVYEDAEQCPSCGMYISPTYASNAKSGWGMVAVVLMIIAVALMVLVPVLW